MSDNRKARNLAIQFFERGPITIDRLTDLMREAMEYAVKKERRRMRKWIDVEYDNTDSFEHGDYTSVESLITFYRCIDNEENSRKVSAD